MSSPSHTTRALLAVFASLTLFLAACGGDDGNGDPPDNGEANGDTNGDTNGEEAAAGTDGDCAGTDLTGTTPDGDFTATSAAAVSLEGGAAYTAYLADFELGDFGIMGPDVPADGTLYNVALTIFNAEEELSPIEVGEVIEYTPDFGVLTFRVMADVGGTTYGNNADAEGTVTVTAVGDRLCAEIDYSDGEKSLSGTFEASI